MNKTTNIFLGVIAVSLAVLTIYVIQPKVGLFGGTTNFNDLAFDSASSSGVIYTAGIVNDSTQTQRGAITFTSLASTTNSGIDSAKCLKIPDTAGKVQWYVMASTTVNTVG
jgi:hypothetical protein